MALLAVRLGAEQRLASPLPFSDEAAHLNKVVDLRDALARADGPVAWLHALWFSPDAYPTLPAAVALPFLAADPSPEGARRALVAWALLLGAVGAFAGARVWGRAGGAAFAALATLAPAAVAFTRLYYVDVPLYALVGAGFVLALATDGFRRADAAIALTVVAAAGMLTKWTWVLFVGPAVALAGARAALAPPAGATGPAWGLRLARAGVLLVLVGGPVAAILGMGGSPRMPAYLARGALAWVPVAVGMGGLLALVGWAALAAVRARRGRPLPAMVNAAATVVCTAALAGPWYTLVQTALWDRWAHERAAWLERGGTPEWAPNADFLRHLLPAGELLLPAGLLVALATRRGGWTLAAAGLGLGLAYRAIAGGLPFDPRYLLPALPLLAGAVVAGWAGLPGRGAAVAAGGVGALLVGLSLAPTPPSPPFPGLALLPRRVAGVSLAANTPAPTSDATAAEVRAVLDALAERCHGERCGARFVAAPDLPLQGRGLTALVRLADLPLVVEEGPGPTTDLVRIAGACRAPLPRLGGEPADCATLPLGRGCRVELCGASSGQGPRAPLPPPPPR